MNWQEISAKIILWLKPLWINAQKRYFQLSPMSQQILLMIGLLVVVGGIFYNLFIKEPRAFPEHSILTIESGVGLNRIAESLKEAKLIRSQTIFKVMVVIWGDERKTQAGDYFFNQRQDSIRIARRIATGDYGLEPIRITVPEGYNIFDIAKLFDESEFDKFDSDEFKRLAIERDLEGYLFPDTYFFPPNTSAKDVLERLNDNYNEQIKTIAAQLKDSPYDFKEIMIVASIVEKEAHSAKDRRQIADVIWRRLAIDMPLQVDVTFSYINSKNSYTLTKDDLKTDSPYNTYVYKGLPPTPIANPSLEAIVAAANPEPNDYLYFLADMSGNVYFAKDFDGHQLNREQYLRQ